jgi:hypothetical protein
MKHKEYKLLAILLILVLAFSALAGCAAKDTDDGSDTTPPTGSDSTSEVIPEPSTRAPYNDPKTIVEGIEALIEPSYAAYIVDPQHLALPPDFSPKAGGTFSQNWPDWDLGNFLLYFGDEAEVEQAGVQIDDLDIASNVMAALYACSVEGNTPEIGQQIADALHVGDLDFAMQYDKYIYVLEYNGYFYLYQIANDLEAFVLPDDYGLAYASCIFFDIDGNEVANPLVGSDGIDENGDYSQTTGDAAKDALVQSLLPPESTINQAKSETVYADSLTDFSDAVEWYEKNLPKLKFISSIPEEQQELLNMDDESHLYSGTIDGQSISIILQDRSGTYGNGDMTQIVIAFTAYGE